MMAWSLCKATIDCGQWLNRPILLKRLSLLPVSAQNPFHITSKLYSRSCIVDAARQPSYSSAINSVVVALQVFTAEQHPIYPLLKTGRAQIVTLQMHHLLRLLAGTEDGLLFPLKSRKSRIRAILRLYTVGVTTVCRRSQMLVETLSPQITGSCQQCRQHKTKKQQLFHVILPFSRLCCRLALLLAYNKKKSTFFV